MRGKGRTMIGNEMVHGVVSKFTETNTLCVTQFGITLKCGKNIEVWEFDN